MRVHFIAIGGSAMHNLALALHQKGYQVSGSDDEIFEPSRSRLRKRGLLPESLGWFPEKIDSGIDAIILGMHARNDNPELIRARELGLKVYSYPEYLYEQTKDKKRIVIGGSHGKTTVTSMVMHVLKNSGIAFDYMVGANVDGFDTMVSLSEETGVAVFEGDEYLSSVLDPRPKFHLYQPHIAVLTGIAWDHINVFPTFEEYKKQFEIFIQKIEKGGVLHYFADDVNLQSMVAGTTSDLTCRPYRAHPYLIREQQVYLTTPREEVPVFVFGNHNMQNIEAARLVCSNLGVEGEVFYKAIGTFKGAAKRLQQIASNNHSSIFLDFAHAPSKLKATVQAVKEMYPDRKLIACFELHTFSSLNKTFLAEYAHTLSGSDEAIVYYNAHTFEHKKMEPLTIETVSEAFSQPGLEVINSEEGLTTRLKSIILRDANLLLMSSGSFSNIDLDLIAQIILKKK